MRVAVCQLGDHAEHLEHEWGALSAHVRQAGSALVVLPEMPFSPWFAAGRRFDGARWRAAVEAHERWIERLPALAPAAVVGSRPVDRSGRRLNEGFVWSAEGGYLAIHDKYYLPEDEGFWEASWYEPGDGQFEPFAAGDARVGVQICTELWFFEHARAYGRAGAHLIAVPRATGKPTLEKWLVGGRAAAVVSGAYVASSNRSAAPGSAADLGGQGWVVGPDGEVLALTSAEAPFATVEVDLLHAARAKSTYPRYVGI